MELLVSPWRSLFCCNDRLPVRVHYLMWMRRCCISLRCGSYDLSKKRIKEWQDTRLWHFIQQEEQLHAISTSVHMHSPFSLRFKYNQVFLFSRSDWKRNKPALSIRSLRCLHEGFSRQPLLTHCLVACERIATVCMTSFPFIVELCIIGGLILGVPLSTL